MLHTPAWLRESAFTRKLSFSLFRRYAEMFKPRYAVERRMGVWLLLDKVDKVDLHLLCGGVWEADRIARLRELILQHRRGRRAVFLDIGAHGALYALVLDKAIGFDRILAFEPEGTSLAQIHANVAMNGLSGRMDVVAKAVADQSGVAAFFVAHESNRGQSHLVQGDVAKQNVAIVVETTTIDETLAEENAFIVAKIDVEGYEAAVIAGMKRTIGSNSVLLQVEKNDGDIFQFDAWMGGHGLVRIDSIGQDHYYLKT